MTAPAYKPLVNLSDDLSINDQSSSKEIKNSKNRIFQKYRAPEVKVEHIAKLTLDEALAKFKFEIEEAQRQGDKVKADQITLAFRKKFNETSRNNQNIAWLKSLDRRKHRRSEFTIYGALICSIPIILAAVYFAGVAGPLLISLALPSIVVGVFGLMALNYIAYSRNWKLTAGRGIAVIISLTTAILGVFAAGGIPLAAAAVLGVGVFLANFILYRASLPAALEGFVNLGRKFFNVFRAKASLKKVSWAHVSWRFVTFPLAIATGLVLTMGMYNSLLPATLLGSLPVLAAVLSAPYIFFPLIAIAFIANSIFVFRSLAAIFDLALEIRNIAKYGIKIKDQATESYEVLKKVDGGGEAFGFFRALISYRFYKALFTYYCNIKENDGYFTAATKFFFHVFIKLAIISLVVFFSQRAVVDVNMAYASKMLSFIGAAALLKVQEVLTLVSYTTRMSFVSVNFGRILTNQFIASFNFMSSPDRWSNFGTKTKTFFTQLFNFEGFSFIAIMKEQAIDPENKAVWIAAFGADWERPWKEAYEKLWLEAYTEGHGHRLAYYFLKALVVSFTRVLTFPAIVVNSVSNGLVAGMKVGNNSPESFQQFYYETPPLANGPLNGLGSGILTLTAKNQLEETRKAMEKGVSPETAPAPAAPAAPEAPAAQAAAPAPPMPVPVPQAAAPQSIVLPPFVAAGNQAPADLGEAESLLNASEEEGDDLFNARIPTPPATAAHNASKDEGVATAGAGALPASPFEVPEEVLKLAARFNATLAGETDEPASPAHVDGADSSYGEMSPIATDENGDSLDDLTKVLTPRHRAATRLVSVDEHTPAVNSPSEMPTVHSYNHQLGTASHLAAHPSFCVRARVTPDRSGVNLSAESGASPQLANNNLLGRFGLSSVAVSPRPSPDAQSFASKPLALASASGGAPVGGKTSPLSSSLREAGLAVQAGRPLSTLFVAATAAKPRSADTTPAATPTATAAGMFPPTPHNFGQLSTHRVTVTSGSLNRS